MTLDEFRAEAAGWIDRPVDQFECTAWLHPPGRRPQKCTLAEADALSVPRAEYEPGPEADDVTDRACTLHEVQVVYVLAQHALGFGGAVQASESGRSWNLYRDA